MNNLKKMRFRAYTELSDLMGHEDNFSRYREALNKALTKPPCTPFIGVFLQTVLAVDTVKDVRGYKKKKPRKEQKVADDQAPDASARRRSSVFETAKARVQTLFHRTDSAVHSTVNATSSTTAPSTDEPEREQERVSLNVPTTRLRSRDNKLSSFQLSDSDMSADDESKPAFLRLRPHDMLFQYQMAALRYNFPSDAQVLDFLLHADYNTDEENYSLSLQREPNNRSDSDDSDDDDDNR